MNENDTIFWHILNFFYIQIDSKKTCLSASNTLILHKRTRLSIDKKLLECLQLQYTSKDFTLSYHRMQTKAVPFKSISSTYSFYSRSINIKILHRLSLCFSQHLFLCSPSIMYSNLLLLITRTLSYMQEIKQSKNKIKIMPSTQ